MLGDGRLPHRPRRPTQPEEDSDDTDSDDEQDKDVYGEGSGQRIQPKPKRIQVEAAKGKVVVAV